jgi:hypothetical protein
MVCIGEVEVQCFGSTMETDVIECFSQKFGQISVESVL